MATMRKFAPLVLTSVLVIPAALALACGAGKKEVKSGATGDDEPVFVPTAGYEMWKAEIQPLVAERCSECHMGERFNTASLIRAGEEFTEEETRRNYQVFIDMISADNPRHSRLLAKILPESEPEAIFHGGDIEPIAKSDPFYEKLYEWIGVEHGIRCSDCGIDAKKAYIAYVQQPAVNWMIEREPVREDRGIRRDAKIMMQEIEADSMRPVGEPFDFLDGTFCADGDCDFGFLAASHDGTKLAFECRVAVDGEPWLERAWNICIADINAEGKAENARFLKPAAERFSGITQTRTTPFAIPDGGSAEDPEVSPYNKHYMLRSRNDLHPAFSPDDSRIYFSSQAPDPRTGDDMVETYHGTFHLKHLVSSNLDGGDVRTVMRNDGGTVDFPFFRKNGNIAAHVWNLERMDRHMISQATADGLMEMPVLVGHLQGPNMWGKSFEMVNGLIVGMTGRRRGELENYAPFVSDHTVGIEGIDPDLTGFQGFRMIDSAYHEEIADYPNGYCPGDVDPTQAATTPNCSISKLVLDTNWTPHNKALVAYSPERVFIGEGEAFALHYAEGVDVAERQASAAPYLPKALGIGTYDLEGNAETIIPPAPGTFSRYPVWVGPRQEPRIQEEVTDESEDWAELHVANVPIWLTFALNTNGSGSKKDRYELASETVALRILRKVSDSNSCVSDGRYIQMSNMPSDGMHPTVLGLVDSTGFEQYLVPEEAGGNEFGDVPLKADGSVRVRVPAGQLLWMVGVNANGHLTAHRSRVSAFPPGHKAEAGVKLDQYPSQCSRCHGSLDNSPLANVRDLRTLPAVMDFDTLAAAEEVVDLTDNSVTSRLLTYRDVLRPLLDENCMTGCHTGEDAAGELSFDAVYSATGNAPKGSWTEVAWGEYVNFLSSQGITPEPSYNYTPTYSFVFRSDQNNYKEFYANQMASHETLGNLAPWDPGYQNLYMKRHYVNGASNLTAMGRVPTEGGNSRHSFLLEVLTGEDLDTQHSYAGEDHTQMLSEEEIRSIAAVLDAGFPFTARCSDMTAESGPNAGEPWGAPNASPVE
jgi:hypothetical protein